MTHVVLDPPGTLLGQLQRGRGRAARAAATARGTGDLVYGCLRQDPRWDPRIESRSLYYARLVVDLELPTGPIAEHLFSPADHTECEEWRTSLALTALADLVRLSRRDAAPTLRRYARDGWNWYEALDLLVELDDARLAYGLDELAISRCDDDDLLGLALYDNSLIRLWALRHRRIGQALDVLRARRAATRRRYRRRLRRGRAATPSARSDHELLRQVRDAEAAAGRPPAHRDQAASRRLEPMTIARAPGRGGRADPTRADRGLSAIIELGRRRSPLVLDLAEESLPSRSLAAVRRALRDLGPVALPRARMWAAAGDDDATADVAVRTQLGIGVLARHGTERDVPVLQAAFRRAFADRDWAAAARPVEGLGRLRASTATPLLRAAWEATEYSYLRPRLLAAMHAGSAPAALPQAAEALWDCEDQARRQGAALAVLDSETALRLRRLGVEPAEDAQVRGAAVRRLREARTAGTTRSRRP